jgi:hypothetical protein
MWDGREALALHGAGRITRNSGERDRLRRTPLNASLAWMRSMAPGSSPLACDSQEPDQPTPGP